MSKVLIEKCFLPVLVFTVLVMGGLACDRAQKKPSPANSHEKLIYPRIVSLAPSTTETLYALGLGDNIVGVTRFCYYPEEAQKKPKVGGYFDINYEVILSLQPDLAVVLDVHGEAIKFFKDRSIKTITVNNRTIEGIHESIKNIGDACGKNIEAETVLQDIRDRTEKIKLACKGLEKPGVMIVVGRNIEDDKISDVFIAGKNIFYDDIIDMAGGKNVFDKKGIDYPKVSVEGILLMDPQVIIEILPELDKSGMTKSDIENQWMKVKRLSAVKNKRVHVFTEYHTAIPGPRYIDTLEDFAKIFHPSLISYQKNP
jgi:cobalamin transport system substrate-binding protein